MLYKQLLANSSYVFFFSILSFVLVAKPEIFLVDYNFPKFWAEQTFLEPVSS